MDSDFRDLAIRLAGISVKLRMEAPEGKRAFHYEANTLVDAVHVLSKLHAKRVSNKSTTGIEAPTCPYCDTEMIRFVDERHHTFSFFCPNCRAESPVMRDSISAYEIALNRKYVDPDI